MNNLRRTALATVLTTAMGVSTMASADIIEFAYDGWFTLLTPGGTGALVNGDAYGNSMYGRRSAFTGVMSYDTTTGTGSGYTQGFSFIGGGSATSSSMSFQAVGDGAGGSGPLILANLGFNWAGDSSIPISLVLDATGFFSAIDSGLANSDIITGSGALPATDDFLFDFGVSGYYTLPIGPSPLVTTTWNTSDIGLITLGSIPSGTLPFTDDNIGGSPMKPGPFPGFNANFDITTLHVVSITSVPVPAAVWLFGTGLMGLAGIARRKKTTRYSPSASRTVMHLDS